MKMNMNIDFNAPADEMEKVLITLKEMPEKERKFFEKQIKELEEKLQKKKSEIHNSMSAWEIVQIARHKDRPVFSDYIEMVTGEFEELHGDRAFSDDKAVSGGFALIGTQKVMIIGHNKGKTVDENMVYNFGMARPDGYRKALRLMRIAERFNIPVVTFINTPGAYPGKDAEERGQHEAIARNLTEMAGLRVPIVTVVTGEGGSGGALGIGMGDSILMLENSIYSVISPEGCASILWRDKKYTAEAADALKLTAEPLKEFGIIDEIIEEPLGGAHKDPAAAAANVKSIVLKHLRKLRKYSGTKLVNRRFNKYAKMGEFSK